MAGAESPRDPRRRSNRRAERAEHLTDAGSQVGVSSALRARDAARPSAHDLAVAETEVTVIRRNWIASD